jgi:hypothetical protein
MKTGCNVTLKYFPDKDYDKYVKLIKDLDFDHVVLEINFFEKNLKLSDFQNFINSCQKENIQVVGLLSGIEPGTLKSFLLGGRNFRESNFYIFAERVGRILKGIERWIIWCEPNSKRFWRGAPNAHEYFNLFKKTSEILKEIDPNNKVIIGDISGNDINYMPMSISGFLNDSIMLTKKNNVKYEYVSFHPYIFSCYLTLFIKKEKILKKVLNEIDIFIERYPDEKIYITEFGISKKFTFRLKQKDIAWIYNQVRIHCSSKDIPLTYWHIIDFRHGQTYSILNPETEFGFLNKKGKPHRLYKQYIKYRKQG